MTATRSQTRTGEAGRRTLVPTIPALDSIASGHPTTANIPVQRTWPVINDSANPLFEITLPNFCSCEFIQRVVPSQATVLDNKDVTTYLKRELFTPLDHSSSSNPTKHTIRHTSQQVYSSSTCHCTRPSPNISGGMPMERFMSEPMITQPYNALSFVSSRPIAYVSNVQSSALENVVGYPSSVYVEDGSMEWYVGNQVGPSAVPSDGA